MLLMVELFHYFSFKVCLLGLLVNMYIFKLSKNYNKSLFQVLIYNLTLIFESFVKIFSWGDSCSSSVFSVFVIVIGRILRGYRNELGKTKRGFCPQQNHSKKPLLLFQQLLSFERFEFIFVAYFQGWNYLIISCFSHTFSACISINWRVILKKKREDFVHNILI